MKPTDLPVYQQKQKILDALAQCSVVVVESPTGSGKTTQLPLILNEAGYAERGIIGVTQPRRIAAVSVSRYIAKQIGSPLGGTAGYKIRFEDITGPETKIKIMTDGILLQELKADPSLSRYSVILVDEAHERSLNIDFILGLLKRILAARPDFKVIVSSATINAEVFADYFENSRVIRIDTPVYPIETLYMPPVPEKDEEALYGKIFEIVQARVRKQTAGDILIFLSGEKQIKDCIQRLSFSSVRENLHILPLYGRLGWEEQERVFDPPPKGKIKVVVSTNIAETSVTIDGISAVIDSGNAKINNYNPVTFTESLTENPVSRASCNQRKGRSGRTEPGTCYRLYTRQDFEGRPLYTTEEIYRTDLSEVVLRMAELGITDFETFDFISSPGRKGIIGAVETLYLLQALENDRSLSTVGKLMAAFPLLPRLSRMIVEALRSYPEVTEETVTAAAFLSTNSPFLLPQGEELEARKAHHTFRDSQGDFVSYLTLLSRFTAQKNQKQKEEFCETYYLDLRTMVEILNVREQLLEIVHELGYAVSSGGRKKDYLCAVAAGLIQFVCVRSGRGIYKSLRADRIHIHPGSVMFRENPQYIVAGELVRTSRMFARSVSPLKREWLPEISTDLAAALLPSGERDLSPREKKEKRDTTNRIKIGGVFFDIHPLKGKKLVILPWEQLQPVLPALSRQNLSMYRKLKGKIIYGEYNILSGYRLSGILKVAQHLRMPDGPIPTPPEGNFASPQDLESLLTHLEKLLTLCSGKKKKHSLGFLTLDGDGRSIYWFTCQKSFHTAVERSLGSLEYLSDDLDIQRNKDDLSAVNGMYRYLTSLL
ncbi:MAG: ATP-dependent RNA helicase [Spirochaetales bacterium]|nr:ATP-dependent RNA helicase [Spirochaetales bacterium]